MNAFLEKVILPHEQRRGFDKEFVWAKQSSDSRMFFSATFIRNFGSIKGE
jgi:hypothetical protein